LNAAPRRFVVSVLVIQKKAGENIMKKIRVFVFVIGIIIMSACGSSNTAVSSTVTPSASPSATQPPPTATITSTPSPTPIPIPPIISASNIKNLQEDFQLGQGKVLDAVWLPYETVALVFSTGISVYDTNTGSLIKSVEPENKAIGSNVMSPSGQFVATPIYSEDKILVWYSNTGKIVYELEAGCQAQWFSYQMVAFNSDGSRLAACDEEGVSLWDLSSGKKINTFKMERQDYLSIAFNPKDNTLATSGYGNGFTDTIIWDLASGDALQKLPQVPSYAFNLRFNHQGNILAWSNPGDPFKGPKITLYDVNTKHWQALYAGGFAVFEFSLDDKTLTFGSLRDGTRLLDIATGEYITEPNEQAARLIKYSPDGKRFVAGWIQFSVFNNVGSAGVEQLGDFFEYNQIAFDPNGKYIAAGWDTVTVWDLQTKKQALDYISAAGNNFLFAPNGGGLITNAGDKNIEQWSFQSKDPLPFEGTISVKTTDNIPPLFSPSGDLLAIGTHDYNPYFTVYIRFWDVNSKQRLFDIKHSGLRDVGYLGLRDYEFSPDGKIFASAAEKTISFWDLHTQKPLKQFKCYKEAYDIAFSPDGALIAAAEANGIQVWDTNSGELAHEFNKVKFKEFFQDIKGTSDFRQVVFSSQGNLLASIGYDDDGHKILFVWDLTNDKPLYKIIGDKDDNVNRWNGYLAASHTGLLFSPGGSLIVTSGLKSSNGDFVQFWDASSGQLIKTLDYTLGFDSRFPYARRFGFSPDGRLFAVADGNVHILQVAASSDNGKEDVLPTSIPILPQTPFPTAVRTATPTPAPTASVESIFPNLRVVKTDTFDNPQRTDWEIDPSMSEIKDGVMKIDGKDWQGIFYGAKLREGYGIIINFKYIQGSEFGVFFENGNWDTDTYKRFGTYIADDQVGTNIWQGKNPLDQALKGSSNLSPDTWYSLCLMIRKNNEFFARIWNPANPAQSVEFTKTFGADWTDLSWDTLIQINSGVILFDESKEVEIK
jgi:WD40 repeat protein